MSDPRHRATRAIRTCRTGAVGAGCAHVRRRRRRRRTTRASPSRFAIWSARRDSTRRANGSPSWWPSISGARCGSPISTSATPPTPTKPCRTRSSRSSATSARIGRPGRSRSGSPAFSSTAVSTGARRARAASAGSRRPRRRPGSTRRARVRRRRRADPEARLLARERRARSGRGVDRLDGRQRTVFMLCHYGDCTPREVSAMTGLNESTVRVHLFRAARKLRGLLGGKP